MSAPESSACNFAPTCILNKCGEHSQFGKRRFQEHANYFPRHIIRFAVAWWGVPRGGLEISRWAGEACPHFCAHRHPHHPPWGYIVNPPFIRANGLRTQKAPHQGFPETTAHKDLCSFTKAVLESINNIQKGQNKQLRCSNLQSGGWVLEEMGFYRYIHNLK